MIVTVFRSRLRPGVREEYVALVERMAALAATMPGYVSHKGFFADDGERVTIVEFEHEEGMRAWRTNPETSRRTKTGAAEVLHRIPHPGLHARPRVEIRGRSRHTGARRGRNRGRSGLTRVRRRAI